MRDDKVKICFPSVSELYYEEFRKKNILHLIRINF
jgi:hypothetical protein